MTPQVDGHAASDARSGAIWAGQVDDRLPTPLYHQIYLILRNKILTGEYPVETVLPSEQDTAENFGVSRITAKRALNELAGDGMVVRERGRGTKVIHHAPPPPVTGSVEGLLENLLTMGLETDVRLLVFDYVRPTPGIATALGCDSGETVQRAVRLRLLEEVPFSYLITHVPERVGRSYSRDDLAERPLLALLERSGVQVSRAEQTISAALADGETAPALGVGLGAPLLRIERVVFDQDERAVEHITALYRPDRYQFRMTLARIGDESTRSWSMTGD